tara:strand:+ start:465 stop:971 length:507 start_codon:yes stop_codon:yes gene_type:complete
MADKKEESWFAADYEAPEEVSAFMKLEDGDNNFRILSPLVTGFEYWTEDNKPVRSKVKWDTTPDNIKKRDGKPTAVKHFWLFLVYNYKAKQVQSLEVTQSTIQKALTALIDNPRWGNPTKFDITINRTGKELLTKYAVVPNPQSDVTPEMTAALEASTIDLQEIFKQD